MKYVFSIMFSVMLSCENKKPSLPILSYNYINGEKEYYKVNDFNFLNQNSESVTDKDTFGKVHTMNFFFTSCPSICPPMRIKQLELADYFKNETNFMQYSISIDLKTDSIQQLKNYAITFGIDAKQFNLLKAASESDLKQMAEKLKTNFKPNIEDTDFYHSSYVALVDKQHYIRGFYNLLNTEDLKLLKKDVKVLLDN